MGAIGQFFRAVAEFFSFKSKKLDVNNTEKMKTANSAQVEADAVGATEKSVAGRDEKSTRNELAE